MIADLRLRTDRPTAFELVLRLLAAGVATAAILGLLPAMAGAAG